MYPRGDAPLFLCSMFEVWLSQRRPRFFSETTKRKEGRLHRWPLFDLVRLMRIRVTERIGVSMRIIRDVYSMTLVCIAKIGIIIGMTKLHSDFMRKIHPFYSRKAVYSHEYAINMRILCLE